MSNEDYSSRFGRYASCRSSDVANREASLSTYRLGLMTGKGRRATATSGSTLEAKRDVLELGRPGLLQFTGETSGDESAATRSTRSTFAGDTSVRYAFRGAFGEVWRQ